MKELMLVNYGGAKEMILSIDVAEQKFSIIVPIPFVRSCNCT